MEFEFDPLKSASNREKHGVDFVQAQHLRTLYEADIPRGTGCPDRVMRTGDAQA